jgi:TRAP-type uncharacterized transport system substrate-binding protein
MATMQKSSGRVHGILNAMAAAFVVLPVDDLAQSSKALEQGCADLAVIRSDIAVPQNGATVVILHNDVAVLAAPAGSTIIKVTDLFKKRVGLLSATTANAALLDAILAEYEIAPETVHHIMLSGDDLAAIVSQKGVDAILAVGPLRGSLDRNRDGRLGVSKSRPHFNPG